MLRNRLTAILKMIPICDIVCDIGTDHAHIPSMAVRTGICKRAIASDVRAGPLERAKRTVIQNDLSDYIDLRLGDGLEPIATAECDVIILSGMGGLLITDILAASDEKARAANLILLQPMHAQEMVRPWLWEHGFQIIDECLVKDSGKIYEILAVRHQRHNERDAVGNDFVTFQENYPLLVGLIGSILVHRHDPLLTEWVIEKIAKQKKIAEGLAKSGRDLEGTRLQTERLIQLKELMEVLI